jgi:hypothetical protein
MENLGKLVIFMHLDVPGGRYRKVTLLSRYCVGVEEAESLAREFVKMNFDANEASRIFVEWLPNPHRIYL